MTQRYFHRNPYVARPSILLRDVDLRLAYLQPMSRVYLPLSSWAVPSRAYSTGKESQPLEARAEMSRLHWLSPPESTHSPDHSRPDDRLSVLGDFICLK